MDLFAGTGSFGLEALSRGAVWVDFVEFAPAAMATILKNIAHLGCGSMCHLWRKKVEVYLRDCTAVYDLIFLDPPYQKNLVNPTLKLILDRKLLTHDGIIVVEHSPKELIDISYRPYLIKEKSSKSSCFSWLSFSPESFSS